MFEMLTAPVVPIKVPHATRSQNEMLLLDIVGGWREVFLLFSMQYRCRFAFEPDRRNGAGFIGRYARAAGCPKRLFHGLLAHVLCTHKCAPSAACVCVAYSTHTVIIKMVV